MPLEEYLIIQTTNLEQQPHHCLSKAPYTTLTTTKLIKTLNTLSKMFTKTAQILALVDLAAVVLAVINKLTSPVPNTNRYTAIASHSGSPIQNLGIAANGRNFYIKKGTSSYCPSPPIDCSNCAYLLISYLPLPRSNYFLQIQNPKSEI